ncbi:MAG: translation initiation factor IF-2 [Candidatus Woesebacteria bacterium]|jgi:translation initiation factor IF-2
MLQNRAAVITIMGHVDHGKTTLLDYIRKTKIQSREAGGITQHIGAYQIEFKNRKITFIDTPGHAAFNKMRQRGAQITDLVILVVAANDGVKPQTIESIRYIKESKVPFIVAINKIDLKDIHLDKVKSELAEQEVLVQDYGGDIDVVEVSAKTGKDVDKLLETVVTMAELLELKADPDQALEAVVIESTKDKRKGPVATVIVQQGTLKARQDVFVDNIIGRVRLLTDENGQALSEVKPGSPAEIIGLKDVPEVGAILKEEGADYQKTKLKTGASAEQSSELELDQSQVWENLDFDALLGEKRKLKLIVKADVKGTLEAILQTLDEESVELISSGVGQVTQKDLELAETSQALLVAFGIKVPKKIKNLAKQLGVKLKEYDIIYHLLEDLQKQMLKIMEPTIDEVVTGEAEILQVFEMKGEKIAGIRVKTGEIKKSDLLHLKRGDEIILNPVINSMKHGKDDILVVKSKNEAGLTFKNKKLDFQVGDILLAYKKDDS